MFNDAYQAVCSGAKGKANLLKKNPLGFFVSSMMAGLFIAFGGFISIGISAPFYEAGDPMQKVMNSASFAVALSFVLMCGAELFTGSNFVLGAAGFRKELSWGEIAKIWVVTYIGNLVGSLLAVAVYQLSGVPTGTVAELFAAAAEKKMTTGPVELICKGILCNALVCMAVWCNTKMKYESGKLIMVFCCIFTFMICGFEHSIANMTTMAVGLLNPGTASVSIGGYIYNLVCVTIGNMIGGIFVVALPYHLISKEK
ncbi:MAG: formate/nitrite transporter family protein [Eubacteriales bacterium]|nr:formate/nitrite transporter family protein [Eubacteriales bacterium]